MICTERETAQLRNLIRQTLLCGINYLSVIGCQLWDLALSDVEHVCGAWHKCVHKVMRLPYRTHNVLLPFICYDISIIEQIHSQFISFIASLLSTGLQTVTKLAFRGSNSALCKSLNYICWKHGMNKRQLKCRHKCNASTQCQKVNMLGQVFAIREFLEVRYKLYCHAEDLVSAGVIFDFLCMAYWVIDHYRRLLYICFLTAS